MSPAPIRTWRPARPIPTCEPLACATFEDALAAVKGGDARYAMIPIENSVAGRVADIHHLLPEPRACTSSASTSCAYATS